MVSFLLFRATTARHQDLVARSHSGRALCVGCALIAFPLGRSDPVHEATAFRTASFMAGCVVRRANREMVPFCGTGHYPREPRRDRETTPGLVMAAKVRFWQRGSGSGRECIVRDRRHTCEHATTSGLQLGLVRR